MKRLNFYSALVVELAKTVSAIKVIPDVITFVVEPEPPAPLELSVYDTSGITLRQEDKLEKDYEFFFHPENYNIVEEGNDGTVNNDYIMREFDAKYGE